MFSFFSKTFETVGSTQAFWICFLLKVGLIGSTGLMEQGLRNVFYFMYLVFILALIHVHVHVHQENNLHVIMQSGSRFFS